MLAPKLNVFNGEWHFHYDGLRNNRETKTKKTKTKTKPKTKTFLHCVQPFVSLVGAMGVPWDSLTLKVGPLGSLFPLRLLLWGILGRPLGARFPSPIVIPPENNDFFYTQAPPGGPCRNHDKGHVDFDTRKPIRK